MAAPLRWRANARLALVALAALPSSATAQHTVTVDAGATLGPIPAIHGVNNGPVIHAGWESTCATPIERDYRQRFVEQAIPETRTHDESPFEMHRIWLPYPSYAGRDPADPSNYDFSQADARMAATAPVTRAFVRLGHSSTHCSPVSYADPPDDPLVWAQVARRVLMHYKSGWANGFTYDVTHVEIWNEFYEPEFWSGTQTEAAQLYAAAYSAIKSEFGNAIQIGPSQSKGPNSVPFWSWLQTNAVPVDFVADHIYATRPREFLDRVWAGTGGPLPQNWESFFPAFGFAATTPIQFTEWNREIGNWQNNVGVAAFVAASLITLVDLHPASGSHRFEMGHFYSAREQLWYPSSAPAHQGVVWDTFGRRMLGATPLRLSATGEVRDPAGFGEDFVVLAGRSSSASRVQVWIAQYENTPADPLPTGTGAAFPLTVTVANLPWGGASFTWERWAHDLNGRGLYLAETGSAGGTSSFAWSGSMLARSHALFVIGGGSSCQALSYCTAGTTTNGCVATMSASGTPSVSATSGFTIAANGVEGDKSGIVFYGVSGPKASPWAPGGTSYLCVKSPTQRMPLGSSGGTAGACDGVLAQDFLAYLAAYPGSLGQPFGVGDTVFAQTWFRDPPAPGTTNLSDGLWWDMCP